MFETQRLVNSFDSETSIREDASSLGQRFFSVFGEINTTFYKDLIRLKTSFFPKKSLTDIISNLYVWDIGNFTFNYESNQNIVIPTISGDETELIVKSSIDDFLNALPVNVIYSQSFIDQNIIYDLSDSDNILDIEIPNYLFIEILDVTSFYSSSDPSLSRAPNFSAKLTLEGEDIYGNSITEYVYPTVNGVYRTSFIYAKLTSLTAVNFEGSFNLRIKALDFNLLEYISKYSFVTLSELQTPLIMDFENNFFYLKYYIFPPKNGQRVSDDKEIFAKVKLLDSNNEEINIKDITFSENREELYVLSDNKICIYDNWIDDLYFTTPQVERSLETLLTADFMYRVSGLEQSNVCYLGASKVGKSIKSYTIYFIDPTGEVFYLNADLELSSTPYTFVADNTFTLLETINNFQFSFTLDVLGQWDLVIESTDFEDHEYTYVTSLLCPSLVSSQDISVNSNYTAIAYHSSGKLYLTNETTIDEYTFSYQSCLLDSLNKKLYTIENYSNLEIVYV